MVASIKNKAIAALLPTAIILIAITTGLYLIKTQFGRPQNTQSPSLQNRPIIQVGSTVPDITLEGDFSQNHFKHIKLSEIKAKVILLNFWASWCDACMSEMPTLVALWNQYHTQGFELLAMNLDDSPEMIVPRIMKQYKMEFPIFQDPSNEVAEFFDVHAIPLTVILNQNRKVLLLENGDKDWNAPEVHAQLERWMAE